MSSSQVTDSSQIRSRLETDRNPSRVNETAHPEYLELALTALIFVVSFLYLWLFRRYTVMDLDEGIVLQGAERILRGEVPYRDFFMFYTPGSVYLVASLFKLFGDSLNVARISIAIAGAGCTILTYVLARRVCSRNIALLAAALTMTTGVAYRFLVLHNWYATLLSCLTVYSAVCLCESQKPLWAFATGSFAALTTLVEQSKGGGLCLGLLLGYLILRFLGRTNILRRSSLAIFSAGFLGPWTLTFLYFGWNHSISLMLEDWLWPLQHYTRVNHVFYGYQNWPNDVRDTIFRTGAIWLRIGKYIAMSPGLLVPALPLAAVAWLAYQAFRLRNRQSGSSSNQYYTLVSAALSGLLVSVVIVRADITHFMYLVPLWYVVLAWILGATEIRSSRLHKTRPFLVAYVCIAFGLMSFALILNLNGARNRIQTRRGVVVTSAKDTVVEYLQGHTAPGEDLLVYPYLPLYNYLTETHSPARLDFFQAGMNTPEQARQIIASLRSNNVRAVLFEPAFAEKFATSWPKTPLTSFVNDPVADFIATNYRVCAALTAPLGWHFQFMVPKGDNCA